MQKKCHETLEKKPVLASEREERSCAGVVNACNKKLARSLTAAATPPATTPSAVMLELMSKAQQSPAKPSQAQQSPAKPSKAQQSSAASRKNQKPAKRAPESSKEKPKATKSNQKQKRAKSSQQQEQATENNKMHPEIMTMIPKKSKSLQDAPEPLNIVPNLRDPS